MNSRSGNCDQKLGKSGEIGISIKIGVVSKFEWKRSKSLDFIANSVFKDFEKKNLFFCATLHLKTATNFERNHPEAWNFAKISSSRSLRSKFMVVFGWSVAQRKKIYFSKSLKTEFAIKSRALFLFYSNFDKTPILIVKINSKSKILRNFKFGLPTKNFKFTPISPILGKKFPIKTY